MSLNEETLKLKAEIEALRSEVEVLRAQKTESDRQKAASDMEKDTAITILTLENQDLQAKDADKQKQIDELEKRIEEFGHVSEDSASITLELADWLRNTKNIPGYGDNLVRFDVVAKEVNRKPKDISVNLQAACDKVGFDLIEKTDSVATVRRRSPPAFV